MKNLILYFLVIILSNIVFAQSVEIRDNAGQILMQINDEGNNNSSITIPSSGTAPTPTNNKLYNLSGTLNWNGNALDNGHWTLNSPDIYYNSGDVGIGTSTPQGVLDIISTSGALIVPRMTSTQRGTLPTINGSIIYNTTDNRFNFYENGVWVTK